MESVEDFPCKMLKELAVQTFVTDRLAGGIIIKLPQKKSTIY